MIVIASLTHWLRHQGPSVLSDVAACLFVVWGEEFRSHWKVHDVKDLAVHLRKRYARVVRQETPRRMLFIAMEDNRVVGAVTVDTHNAYTTPVLRDQAWLANIFVSPKSQVRKLNLRAAILRHALAYCQHALGASRVYMCTFSKRLEEWYAAELHFHTLRVVPNRGDGFFTIMCRRLESNTCSQQSKDALTSTECSRWSSYSNMQL
jgi:hypothetical protein